jgi:two-component system, chemotaxis family, response regulator Rcp1
MKNEEKKTHQMEILLIEDNLADACATIVALKEGRIPHRLTLICDGMEAMEFLHQQGKFARAPRPDLILLDLQLPYKDGREVLKEVKSDYELKDIALVVLTVSHDDHDRLQSELLHVDSYVTKPVDLEKFLSLVKQLRRQYLLRDVIMPVVGTE